MNYIMQIKGFWVCHEAHQFTTNEIAMYFILLEVWNKTSWAEKFLRNNYKMKADLGLSHKTMHATRVRLMDAGIIVFNQSNGHPNVLYKMTDLSKNYQAIAQNAALLSKNYSADTANVSSVEAVALPNLCPDLRKNYQGLGVVNINQTNQTITEDKSSVSELHFSEIEVDAPQEEQNFDPETQTTSSAGKEEKKKSCAKKRKEEKRKALHWAALSKVWFDIHLDLKKTACPRFTSTDGSKLRSILLGLEDVALAQSYDWTETNAVAAFTDFLRAAHTDAFLSRHWLLKNIDQNFNTIVSLLQNPSAVAQGKKNTVQGNYDAVLAAKELLKKQREQKN